MKKPNIIFYFSDQQRYDTLNAEVMPYLTSLKSEATSFESAYTCQPVCGPARACLQTGQYASNVGCYRNDQQLNPSATTLAKLFDANGYDTAYIGKWHLASNGILENYTTSAIPVELRGGYRYWRAADCLELTSDGYHGYLFDNDNKKLSWEGNRADIINDFALEYLKTGRVSDKPFLMFVSQLEPHHQNSTDKYECPAGMSEQFADYPIPADLTPYKGNYEKRYADYLGCCKSLDNNLERLVTHLKDAKLWDNTILIYTADHGCHFRTRNMEYKRSCHDSSIHIPLLIVGGAFSSGKSCDALVSLIDLPTTMLSLAGITPDKTWEGYSALDIANGKAIRQNVFIEISESQLGRAIRTKDWTYSVRARHSLGLTSGKSKVYIEDKLYDNINDPNQLNNLIKDSRYNDKRMEMRAMLSAEILKLNHYKPIIKPRRSALRLNP